MYLDDKLNEVKKFNKLLIGRKLQNIGQYQYEPNLNSLLFDYIQLNPTSDIDIPISYKEYSENEDEISFMINSLSAHTPNFVYTYSKDDRNLWREDIGGIMLKEWIRNKKKKYVSQVLQQIFLSYSLAYDALGLVPYRIQDIYIIDLGEEREIIYQDLSNNYFSFNSQYLVKINDIHMMYKGELMSYELKDYLTKFSYYNYALTQQGIDNIISNAIKEIFKLSKDYKRYSTNNQIYNFYDANALIELQMDLTDNRYASRSEILQNCLVGVKDIEIFVDTMNQTLRDYKPFLKKYFSKQ